MATRLKYDALSASECLCVHIFGVVRQETLKASTGFINENLP